MTAARLRTAAVLASLVLAVCSCGRATRPAPSMHSAWPAPVAGVHWRLQEAQGPGGSTVFPGPVAGWLETTATGAVDGSDGCAFFNARSSAPVDQLLLSQVVMTANGCLPDHGPRDAVRRAVGAALLSGHPARVAVTGGRLVVRGSGYVLTYGDAGPATHGAQPTGAPTSGRSAPSNRHVVTPERDRRT